MYPTAAKLVAALVLAATGYVTSEAVKPLLPEDTVFGMFSLVNAVLGLLCGWIIVGPRAGQGASYSLGAGLSGVAALAFWGLLVQAARQSFYLSLGRRFDGPMEAILDMLNQALEWGLLMLWHPPAAGALILGGAIAGLLSEFAALNWR
jgi:hypothetical protein